MIRKLIKQGNQAYTVTLPITWIRDNNLEAGHEIDVSPSEHKLVIDPQKHSQKKRSIVIDLNGEDFNLYLATLIETYTLGFDQIVISSPSQKTKEHLETITSNYFMGFELTDSEKHSYIIENVSEPGEDRFRTLFRKMFLICVTSFKDIIDSLEHLTPAKAASILEMLQKMETYNNFCMRIISRKLTTLEATFQMNLVLSFLTKFKRSFVYLIKGFEKKKITLDPEWKDTLYNLHEHLVQLYDAFYSNKTEEINHIYERNRKLRDTKIYSLTPKDKQESILHFHLAEFQTLINYMTAPLMAITINNKRKEKDVV